MQLGMMAAIDINGKRDIIGLFLAHSPQLVPSGIVPFFLSSRPVLESHEVNIPSKCPASLLCRVIKFLIQNPRTLSGSGAFQLGIINH